MKCYGMTTKISVKLSVSSLINIDVKNCVPFPLLLGIAINCVMRTREDGYNRVIK